MTDPQRETSRWDEVLMAWLHDPPDKALAVSSLRQAPSHESRRGELAKALLGSDEVSQSKIKKVTAAVDVMAAQVERLPMPKGQHVNVENGRLTIRHPLAAGDAQQVTELLVPEWDQRLFDDQKRELQNVVQGLPGQDDSLAFNRFLAIWRLGPDALTDKIHPCFARLPAETRTPDHTIWNHLDVTAAFKAAQAEGGGAALLTFALGPVQRFIEAARSVRDLWSGSMILSWLAFRAMLPVIERLGPTALVYPVVRGNPLLDMWLRDNGRLAKKVPLPDVRRRLTPSLPHRFLAIVPWGNDGSTARELGAGCERAVADAWKEMTDAVNSRVKDTLDALFAGWDKRWDDQIPNYFTVATAIVPLAGSGEQVDGRLSELLACKASFTKAFADAQAVREMARVIPESDRPGYPQDHAGRWQYQVELVNRSLAAQRSIRHVPRVPIGSGSNVRFPQKCTLLGSFEQMGPDGLAESKDFWDRASDPQSGLNVDGVRLRKGEALCAVAMVKRFAGPAFLANELNVKPAELRFADTWTVATAEWLSKAGTAHDDPDEPQCPADVLKAIKEARERVGKAPVYYAILKLDGDDLGGWLRGENSPTVREVMHPDLVRYYERLETAATAELDAKRPVGPALHAAISTALANFALHAVPEIVAGHHGTTIYSGGDDTLVLLPVSTALACALELRQAYMSEWWRPGRQNQREYLMMGSRATLSGGLVIVHAKDDLRLALQDARRAEKQAKDAGKDALVITIRRRSGEHTSALCPWEFADTVRKWVAAFLPANSDPGASDRWAYHLKAEEPTLAALEAHAIRSEIRRQANRAEKATRQRLGEPEQPKEGERAGDILVSQFDQHHKAVVNDRRRFDSAKALKNWLTLCQASSFMARGRD